MPDRRSDEATDEDTALPADPLGKELRSAPTPLLSADELEDGAVESKTPWPGTGPAPVPESLDWRWLAAALATALLVFALAYLLDPP